MTHALYHVLINYIIVWTVTHALYHVLINYVIDTKAKCHHLKKLTCKGTLRQKFITVYVDWKQSVMLVFSTQLCELLPLQPSLWFNSPPPFLFSKYSIDRQCVWLGGGRGGVTIFCRRLTLRIWPVLQPEKRLDHPKQKPRSGGGLRQINTCRKVPLQVNFLDETFCFGVT